MADFCLCVRVTHTHMHTDPRTRAPADTRSSVVKCSHMLRSRGGYRNEDNDLKRAAPSLMCLSQESREEGRIGMEVPLAAGVRELIEASPVYLDDANVLCAPC